MGMILAQVPAPALSSGQVVAFVLFGIALILAVARVMGLLAKRFGQPAVVGEIIAGVLLGPTLLGPAVFHWRNPPAFLACEAANPGVEALGLTHCLFPQQARGVLGVIGQIALLLFMFLVGLEFDFKLLRGRLKAVVIVGLGVVMVPILVGFALNPLLFNETFAAPGASAVAFGLFVGAMLSVTAFPVMVRILQEKGLTLSSMGSVGIAAAALVTILMFIAVSLSAGVAGGATTGELAANFGLTAVYIAVMALVVRPLLKPLGQRYEVRVAQLGGPADEAGWSQRDAFAPAGVGWALTSHMFAFIMILVFLSGWVAHVLGINVIVGGFMAGLVLPARKGLIRDMTNEVFNLTAIVLLPVFLAFSGLNTDFTQLAPAALGGIGVFLVAGIASKWIGGAVFGRLGGLSWAEANVLGVLLNCRGLLVLVVALIGVQAEVITPLMQLGGVLMALITTMMTGPLFDSFIGNVESTRPRAETPREASFEGPGAQ